MSHDAHMTHTVTQSHTRLARVVLRVVCGRARGAGTARGAILQYGVRAHTHIPYSSAAGGFCERSSCAGLLSML